MARALGEHALFFATLAIMMMPIFVTRHIIYGTVFESGYPSVRTWYWTSPVLLRVLFSSDHGMLSWTPILIPAMLGLIAVYRRDRLFGGGLLLALLAYYYFIAGYPDWDGFVVRQPVLCIFDSGVRYRIGRRSRLARRLVEEPQAVPSGRQRRCRPAGAVEFRPDLSMGHAAYSQPGPVPWSAVVHNQYAVVPVRIAGSLEAYFLHRGGMMQHIESQDLERLRQ